MFHELVMLTSAAHMKNSKTIAHINADKLNAQFVHVTQFMAMVTGLLMLNLTLLTKLQDIS